VLKVVEHIKKYGLCSLADEYSIKIKRHPEFSNLVLLKYSQINTPMNDITRECRGIILDENDDWRPVCYTYKRFANIQENWGDTVDFNTAKIYEKLDGSLMQLYYYGGSWRVASSGTPDGGGEVMGTTTTFAELFWKVWASLNYAYPIDKDTCYAFELMTQYNRVVVKHKEPRLVLHGARNLSDFTELDPKVVADKNGWECVKTYPFDSWEDVLSATDDIDPAKGEGFVACDENYNRTKIKSKKYVALAHFRDGITARRILDIVRKNESLEFLGHFPEFGAAYNRVSDKYQELVKRIENFYDSVKHIEDKKQFAMMVKDQQFSEVLFCLHNGKVKSVNEALSEVQIKRLEGWLGLKSVVMLF